MHGDLDGTGGTRRERELRLEVVPRVEVVVKVLARHARRRAAARGEVPAGRGVRRPCGEAGSGGAGRTWGALGTVRALRAGGEVVLVDVVLVLVVVVDVVGVRGRGSGVEVGDGGGPAAVRVGVDVVVGDLVGDGVHFEQGWRSGKRYW